MIRLSSKILFPLRLQQSVLRYGVVVLTVGVVLMVKLTVLKDIAAVERPFLLFFTAIMISAWYGGRSLGFLATFLSAVVADYFFVKPVGEFNFSQREIIFQTLIFISEGSIISLLCHQIQAAGLRVKEAAARQMKSKEELQKAKDEADAANRAKSSFLANISHEIRTPLSAMISAADLLKIDKISPSEKEAYLKIINRNGRELAQLINDILDLSKIEAGHVLIDKTDVTLADFMSDLQSSLAFQVSRKETELTVVNKPSLPRVIHTDPLRLRQILLNIVGNAIKFTERGHVLITVELESGNLAQPSRRSPLKTPAAASLRKSAKNCLNLFPRRILLAHAVSGGPVWV